MAHERDWLKHIYTNFDIGPSSRVTYTRKFKFQNHYVFTIQEVGDRMSPISAASLCNIPVQSIDLESAHVGPIDLEQALIDIDEASPKFGHLTEETFRQRLSEEGFPWAKSFAFDTLADVVEWVGINIKSNKAKRNNGLRTVVRMCVENFDGYKDDRPIDWTSIHTSRGEL